MKNVLVWIVVAIAVFMMIFTLISVNMFDKNDRNLFGFRFYTVLSDSMSATDFSAGDIVIIKEVDPSTLEEGDIISYISLSSESYGEVITHKIRSRTTDENGRPGFITYGTTTNTDDDEIVTYKYILGIYKAHIPKKTTKRALVSSIMAIVLCFSMLLGTTFAWFTDTVANTGNKIVAGSLDVQLLMWNGTDYVDISDSNQPIFGSGYRLSQCQQR